MECAEPDGPGPVQAEHADADRADPQREREDRPGSGLPWRGGEGRHQRPASAVPRSEARTGPPDADASSDGSFPGVSWSSASCLLTASVTRIR